MVVVNKHKNDQIKFGKDFFYIKIYNKTEVVCKAANTISLDEFVLDEFVFVKYFKLSNFKLLNGQLFVLLN